MRLLKQPNDVTCGQTSVAMVLGCSVRKAISLFGHDGATKTHELIRVLRGAGKKVASRLKRTSKAQPLPDLCVVHLKVNKKFKDYEINKRWGHWAVYCKGKYYDPTYGLNPVHPEGVVVASYLEIGTTE